MLKTIFLLLTIVLAGHNLLSGASNTSSQTTAEAAPTFVQGDIVFNLGLGIGTTIYSGSFYAQKVLPVSFSLEYGYMEDFLLEDLTLGLGAYVGYAKSRYENPTPTEHWGHDNTYVILGGRGGLHYPIIENFDTYAGAMLGVNIISKSYFGDNGKKRSGDSSGLIFSLYAGGRYYITEQFAFMGEIGYGIAYLNLGIAYKL